MANTYKHSLEHRPRASRSPPPFSPPATPQLPPTIGPGLTFTKDPPPLRHPPGPRHNAAQPPSMGIAAVGPTTPRPVQLPAGPRGHRGSREGLGAPRHAKPGRGPTAAFPRGWEGEGRVKGSAAEQRRGARRQPGYWKPSWAGGEGGGCGRRLGVLTAPGPAAPPAPQASGALSPVGAAWPCHILWPLPGSIIPLRYMGSEEHRSTGSKVLVRETAGASGPGRAPGTRGHPPPAKG